MISKIITVVACAGLSTSVSLAEDPVTLEPSVGQIRHRAHIYFNVASGERVVTVLDEGQAAGADSGVPDSNRIWSALVQDPCADFGYTTQYYFDVDNPSNGISLCTQATFLDYGDIQANTVVDCIQVNWVTEQPDSDLDHDSVGDGVEELAGQWMVWDADNGREINQSTRLPLVDVLFYNLPGNIAGQGGMSSYTLEVDLVAGFSGTDLSFEIGDTDGDCQAAAFCNSSVLDIATGDYLPVGLCDNDFDGLLDSDLDGDGLFDFSWTVRFYTPGRGHDFDSDGDTGTAGPTNSDVIGISFGVPEGSAVDDGVDPWTWNVDTTVEDAGTGVEDRFVLYYPPVDDGMGGEIITYAIAYWFGGFACTGGLIDTGGTGYTPPAMFQFVLYNSSTPCDNFADYNGDGQFDFFDVSAFIVAYQSGDGDYNGDGRVDFFDVSDFLRDFNLGCP